MMASFEESNERSVPGRPEETDVPLRVVGELRSRCRVEVS